MIALDSALYHQALLKVYINKIKKIAFELSTGITVLNQPKNQFNSFKVINLHL
jgi:rRNA pseudouridine-1189 N-methylase Emg1 (Nep1/Mra1 family)